MPVDEGAGNQTDPHISGTLVSYTSQSGPNTAIRYHDLASDVTGEIPGGGQDLLSDVFDGTIAFTRFMPGGAAIFAYDTAAGSLWELDPQLDPQVVSQRRGAAIGGDQVAWEDFGLTPELEFSSEIVVYDRPTGTTIRLTEDELFDLAPQVSPDGSVLVWLKCTSVARTGGCEVWQAVRGPDQWTSTPVSNVGEHTSADTDGEVVVYTASRDGERSVYWTPVSGGGEQRLDLPPGIQRNASVSGGQISFESNHNQLDNQLDAATFDMFVYDLQTGRLSQITDTPTLSEQLNDISLGPDGKARLVWSAGLSGDLNVYAYEFTPAGRGAAEVVFHAPVVAPPDVNVIKAGRVLPVRVSVSVDGVAEHTGPVAIGLNSLAACPEGAASEPVDATAPGAANSGNLFSFQPDSGLWAYNLDTKGLAAGSCHRVEILLGGTIDPATGRATGGTLAGWFLLRLRP
jgi:hypothetical protein